VIETDEALAATVARILADDVATVIAETPDRTIRPEARAFAQLERGDSLELRELLGQGGMGVVHSAWQQKLGRDVAVKSAHGPEGARRLLQEAWVTARIEHPNVIPIYDIRIEDGAPTIVMRRIEGDEWGALMDDAEAVRERFGAEDSLEWNLRVLTQVCNVLQRAHDRRVVHRDLKPENVMVGAYGEVYVLDWGIAVSLDPDERRLPRQEEGVVGTPCYMAPELLGGGPHDARTDVFLAGALLHRIVLGRPPYAGSTLNELIVAIAMAELDVPDDVPEALAGILRRAMARKPEDRFPSADALRQAIERFLSERSARRLAALADDRTEALSRAEDAATRRRLYGEARFGYQLASREGVSVAGLGRAVSLMVRAALEDGDAQEAARLLEEHPQPPEDLVVEVEGARRTAEEERASLERLAREQSFEPGRRGRRLLAATVLPLAVMVSVASALAGAPRFELIAATSALAAIGGTLAMIAARRTTPMTDRNRTVFAYVLLMLWAPMVFDAAVWATGGAPEQAVVVHLGIWGIVMSTYAWVRDPLFWPIAFWLGIGFAAAAAVPAYSLWVVAAAIGVSALHIARIVITRQRALERDA